MRFPATGFFRRASCPIRGVLAGAWVAGAWAALPAMLAAPPGEGASRTPPVPVQISASGQVTVQGTRLPAPPGGTVGRLRADFGMPNTRPGERAVGADGQPAARTQWLFEGIRYTQEVLVTRASGDHPWPPTVLTPDTLVLVRLTGENTGTTYTNAQAALSLEWNGKPLDLAWHDGVVRLAGNDDAPLLALVEIAGSALIRTNARRFEFEGHMPPGTSGSMVVKLPVDPAFHAGKLDRLRDFDFNDELSRLRKARPPSAAPGVLEGLPLGLAPD